MNFNNDLSIYSLSDIADWLEENIGYLDHYTDEMVMLVAELRRRLNNPY